MFTLKIKRFIIRLYSNDVSQFKRSFKGLKKIIITCKVPTEKLILLLSHCISI